MQIQSVKSSVIRKISATVLPFVALVISAAPAQANLVQNGSFEMTLVPGPGGIGTLSPSQEVTNWSTSGYNFVFTPGVADTTGANGQYGNLRLWGPGSGSANGLPASSPDGGNFIGADGAYEVGALTQTIRGLTPGRQTVVSFYWAGAQQAGYNSPTTEQWQVSLGDQTISTPVVSDVSRGFTGWVHDSFTFTPRSSTEVLSFLAQGTPGGEPPFSLLDGVSVTTTPEPAYFTLVSAGLAGLIAIGHKLRNRK